MNSYQLTPEKLLLLLVFVTIGTVLFHGPLLETRLVIRPGDSAFRFELDSDVQDGGDTRVEWLDKDQLKWRCVLGQGWDYPFCGMQIFFGETYLQGRDLSRYTHLNFRLRYQGSGETIRVFLRNSDPQYTRPGEIRSTKFNTVEINTRHGPDYHRVELSYFGVADWWLQLYDLDMHQARPDFSNVGLIEIQTGTGLRNGEHIFKLDYLELVGVRLAVETLYLGIIVTWICAILLYLAARIRMLTLAVRVGQEKQDELREINALLDKRSRTLEEKSKIDPLTGAYNRAGIEGSLAQAFSNWRYRGTPLSLLLIDVDHFKEVNDTYGHGTGDQVLRELAIVMSDNIRAEDHLARWGGEEFIIVCGDTPLPPAATVAEKLRAVVSESRFADGLQITVSIGVAQIRRGETLETLFARTDRALYAAKGCGRDQVRTAD